MYPDLKPPIKKNFGLIETMLWENGEYFLLDLHIARLFRSAAFLGRKLSLASLRKSLNNISGGFFPEKKFKVRLVVSRDGSISISFSEITPLSEGPVKAAISDKRTDKSDVFLYHKTTERALYDTEHLRAVNEGLFDLLFLNTDGEVTEGAITNIMILKDGAYFTPPISCGVLPGVFREHLLGSNELPVKEKVLSIEDLLKADGLFLINSVRKIVPARLETVS